MAIDIRSYRPVTDAGRRVGSDRSYYMVTHNRGRGQCRLYIDAATVAEVEASLGGSVGLSYSAASGVVVMHAQDYDNSRMISRSGRRGVRSLRGSISTAFMQELLERLFGIHRRYYVTVTRDEDLDGNPVFVVAPSGEVA